VGYLHSDADWFCAVKGSHHTRQSWWHSHDNLMGDNKWAWLEYCDLRDFRGQPQLYCKWEAYSVYFLQLHLRIHSSLHNQKVGGHHLIRILVYVCLFLPHIESHLDTHLCFSLTQSITMLLGLDKRWGSFGLWPLQKVAQMFHIRLVS